MVDKFGMKADQHFGVDSRWSWITALFCAWVMFLTMATPRMSGIFFYGIVEAFGVTRAEASWPVSLAGTFMALGETRLADVKDNPAVVADPSSGAVCKVRWIYQKTQAVISGFLQLSPFPPPFQPHLKPCLRTL
ncbi:hypothetical protein HPB52_018784 [Rhipicephalus sanguineus]|uniref:Uncharacterized protein n=1 Tax=Rhipicephalus sanguineus TaxID=34632 RepID=A0A9D4PJK7_RHISA|nr:hypothetical protein HPB52_018784 [Rhipicephalus sanguineus]